jgi:hypothetical protein
MDAMDAEGTKEIQEAISQNFKVLAGLRSLFQLLSEHGAVYRTR